MTSPALSIGELSDATGVKTVTLRAWERRHGLLRPARSEGGHRLYQPSDVARVMAIRGWLDQGVTIGRVAPLLAREEAPNADLELTPAVEACLKLNARHLEQLFNSQSRELPLPGLYRNWMLPLREELLALGSRGSVALAFLDGFFWQKMSARVLKESRRLPQRPRVLIQPVSGAHSHPAAAVVQLLAMEQGWPALMLCQSPGVMTLAQTPALEGLQARVLVQAPESRPSDLRLLCRDSERLGVSHFLVDVSGGVDPAASDGPDWCYQGADIEALVVQLQKELGR